MSNIQYTDEHIRFIIKQRETTDLTWDEIKDAFKEEFGIKKSMATIRSAYLRYNSYSVDNSTIIDSIRSSHRVKKTNSKIRKENKAILDEMENQEVFFKTFNKLLGKAKITLHKKVKIPKKKKIKRSIIAHLSDIHIEANIEADEMGGVNRYGRKEQARRLAFFFKQVANYKKDHRKETKLNLVINGDQIQGLIHSIEKTSPMTTQVAAAIHLLTQGISYLAQHFHSIDVFYTVGNHGRVVHLRDNGRATDNKWDNYSTLVGIGIQYFLKSYKNVNLIMPVTPYVYTNILGHNFFITHGDGVINPGNVGKNISTDKLNNRVNDLINGVGPIDAVMLGHVHVPVFTILNNGVYLAVNGCVSGVDPFCQSIGILRNSAVQQIFEVTEKHPIGDMRFVNLLEADKEKELDNIITPFNGKF